MKKLFCLFLGVGYLLPALSQHAQTIERQKRREQREYVKVTQIATHLSDSNKKRRMGAIAALVGLGAAGRKSIRLRVQELINQLGSPVYQERERAMALLWEFGPHADSWLRRATKSKNLETAKRASKLLESQTVTISPDTIAKKFVQWLTAHPDIDELVQVADQIDGAIDEQKINLLREKFKNLVDQGVKLIQLRVKNRIPQEIFLALRKDQLKEHQEIARKLFNEYSRTVESLGYRSDSGFNLNKLHIRKGAKAFSLFFTNDGFRVQHPFWEKASSIRLSRLTPEKVTLENSRIVSFRQSNLLRDRVYVGFHVRREWGKENYSIGYRYAVNQLGPSTTPIYDILNQLFFRSETLPTSDLAGKSFDHPRYYVRP